MPETIPSVLLVDDVEANLVALEALLGDMKCELVRARGGNEALLLLLKQEFAVMLLDVQMPDVDGFEVARYARDNPVTREVPIIFLTAMHHSQDNVLRGYGTGAVDFLSKPIDAQVLRSKVHVFLELYSSRKRLSNEVVAHKATLASLRLANEALRHFTNAASHDLRAPLRAIRGFLAVVSERAGDALDATSRDYLERSLKAGLRMDALLTSLLSYAGLQKPPAFQAVDCGEVLEQIKTDLAGALQAAQSTLSTGELPTVHADPNRLYQVFLNLVNNALKFRSAGAAVHVHVSARAVGAEQVVCVEDDGIGIGPENCQRIFEAFQRVHGVSAYEGSGLGLMICKQIVEQHNGRIWVESELGRGSKFYVALPSAQHVVSPAGSVSSKQRCATGFRCDDE